MELWVQYLLAILSGLAVAIPLTIQLVEYVKKNVKEKNWGEIVKLTIGYMTTAETMFTDGASRKDWVIAMVRSSAQSIEYDLDEVALTKISNLIDSICAAAKLINVPKAVNENKVQIKLEDTIPNPYIKEPALVPGHGTFDE